MIIEKLKWRLLRLGMIASSLMIVGAGCWSIVAFHTLCRPLAGFTAIQPVVLALGGMIIAACCALLFHIKQLLTSALSQAPLFLDPPNAHLWKTIFEYSLEGIMMTDARGNIVKVNPAFTQVTGYTADECLGKNPRFLKSGIHDIAFYQQMWDSIQKTGQWQSEIWNRRKNGEAYLQWFTIHAIKNDYGEPSHYVALFHDMTDIKQHQERITYQAYHDALTGLPNRQLFQDHLNMALAHAHRNSVKVGVIFLDLDNFKTINDSLGHPFGDLLLQEAAKRLKQCCRGEDTVARFGGDEFMLLFPDIKENGHHLLEVVQRLLLTFSAPFLLRNHEIAVTASIGVTVYPEDGEDVATLIKNAELAMYRAKEHGRNTYMLYTKTMYTLAVERMELETSLRKALKNQEFRVYYQPQVNIKTGLISGSEALVRWQRSETELISPDKFISLAEETGLILPLGEWVLRTACEQTKAWHDAGFPWLTVSVNLSARQFQDKCLVRLVRETLKHTQLDPRFLRLEITENTVMKNVDLAISIMYALEQIGVYLSIDDFGTGYSSLSYLKCFPLKEIKIDKSFVREIPDHQDDIAIAKAILSLAHSLNLRVLAEGVETQVQLDFMRQHSCDEIQGYLFSQPVCANDLILLLRKGKKLPI